MAIDVTGSVSVGGSITTVWWELSSGGYANSGAVLRLTAVETSTNSWEVSINNGLAQAAVQELVDGQDPGA